MRVLIVATNRCRQPTPVIPFGACLVAQAAQRAGHEVALLDLMFQRRPRQALRDTLEAFDPHVVGLSIRNIDNNDILRPEGYIGQADELARVVRRHSHARLILGGAAMGVMGEAILRRLQADYAVCGEGETVLPELLAALAADEDGAAIPGVLALRSHDVVGQARAGPRPLVACTADDFARWIDLRAYTRRMTAVPVQAKRGCPFDCTYCTYNLAEGRTYRLHDPAAVARAVARLAGQGVRHVEFVDNVFNSPPEHARAICDELSPRKAFRGLSAGPRLLSLELNPRFVDDPLLEAMERAGFAGIGITVESAAQDVLEGLGKNYGPTEIRQAAACVRRHRLPCLWIFLLGGPGETPQTVDETFAFARESLRPADTAFFAAGLRVYPGTPLEAVARSQGVLDLPPERMLDPVFYVSPQIGLDHLRRRLQKEVARRMNFLAGDVLSLPLLQRVMAVTRGIGLPQPMWRHTRAIRKALDVAGIYP